MFMKILIFIFLFIIGGLWRRLFGGWLSNIKIISNRFIQHLIGFIVLFLIMYLNKIEWYFSIIYAISIQGLFWAPGHGMIFDIGRKEDYINQEDLERYKKTLGNNIVNIILSKNLRYGFLYDFLCMFFRYTIPTLIFIYHIPYFIVVGMLISPIYAFCHTLFEKEQNLKLFDFINYPTALAEFICGGLVYSSLFLFLQIY